MLIVFSVQIQDSSQTALQGSVKHLYNTYAYAVHRIALKAKHAHWHEAVKSLKKKIYCLDYYGPGFGHPKIVKLMSYEVKLVSIVVAFVVAFVVDKNLHVCSNSLSWARHRAQKSSLLRMSARCGKQLS